MQQKIYATSEVKYFSLACFDLRLTSLGFDEETKLSLVDFSGEVFQKRIVSAIMGQKTEVIPGINHSWFWPQLNVSEKHEDYAVWALALNL